MQVQETVTPITAQIKSESRPKRLNMRVSERFEQDMKKLSVQATNKRKLYVSATDLLYEAFYEMFGDQLKLPLLMPVQTKEPVQAKSVKPKTSNSSPNEKKLTPHKSTSSKTAPNGATSKSAKEKGATKRKASKQNAHTIPSKSTEKQDSNGSIQDQKNLQGPK